MGSTIKDNFKNINRVIILEVPSLHNPQKGGGNKLQAIKAQSTLIIDKISIVLLKLPVSINIQLSQTKEKLDNKTVIFGGLIIIILMENFS